MAAICPSVIHLCYVRFTRIDAVGEPIAGPNNVYVSDKPISLSITPDVLAGEVKDQKSGCDTLLLAYRGQDIVKRQNLELMQGVWSPGLEEMLTGGAIILDDALDPIGVDLPSGCDHQQPFLVLEAWQDLYECDHQLSVPYQFRRWTFPSTRWIKGDETAQNDVSLPKFTGFTVGNDNWGIGIYGDNPYPVGPAGQVVFTNELPTAACGYQTQALTD